ncbi:hypothetical protein YC2023_012009 [Brassica napus]
MGLDIGNQWTVCPIDISRPKEELQIGNSDELSNLPESESETETRDEKISEATASTPPPPLSRSRYACTTNPSAWLILALEKKNHIKMRNTKKTPTLKAFESKSST